MLLLTRAGKAAIMLSNNLQQLQVMMATSSLPLNCLLHNCTNYPMLLKMLRVTHRWTNHPEIPLQTLFSMACMRDQERGEFPSSRNNT